MHLKINGHFRTAGDLSKLMLLQKSTQKKLSKATIETLVNYSISSTSNKVRN